MINTVGHLILIFQVTLRGCSYEKNYTTKAVSRTNYFRKMGAPKIGSGQMGTWKNFQNQEITGKDSICSKQLKLKEKQEK